MRLNLITPHVYATRLDGLHNTLLYVPPSWSDQTHPALAGLEGRLGVGGHDSVSGERPRPVGESAGESIALNPHRDWVAFEEQYLAGAPPIETLDDFLTPVRRQLSVVSCQM